MSKKMVELVELIKTAEKAADVVTAKGVYNFPREVFRCVDLLRRITHLSLTADLVRRSNAIERVLSLARHGNPKIRSEAKSLLDFLRTAPDAKRNGVCLRGKSPSEMSRPKKSYPADTRRYLKIRATKIKDAALNDKKSGIRSETEKKKSVYKEGLEDEERAMRSESEKKKPIDNSEALELLEAVKNVADEVSLLSLEPSRCIEDLGQLEMVPPSLIREIILTTTIGPRLQCLTQDSDPNIQSAAKSLRDVWFRALYASGRRPNDIEKKNGSSISSEEKETFMTGSSRAHSSDSSTSLPKKTALKTNAGSAGTDSSRKRIMKVLWTHSRSKMQRSLREG